MGIIFPLKTEMEADRIACWERPPKKYDLKYDVPWVWDLSSASHGADQRDRCNTKSCDPWERSRNITGSCAVLALFRS